MNTETDMEFLKGLESMMLTNKALRWYILRNEEKYFKGILGLGLNTDDDKLSVIMKMGHDGPDAAHWTQTVCLSRSAYTVNLNRTLLAAQEAYDSAVKEEQLIEDTIRGIKSMNQNVRYRVYEMLREEFGY